MRENNLLGCGDSPRKYRRWKARTWRSENHSLGNSPFQSNASLAIIYKGASNLSFGLGQHSPCMQHLTLFPGQGNFYPHEVDEILHCSNGGACWKRITAADYSITP
jgi:hypothetical protein